MNSIIVSYWVLTLIVGTPDSPYPTVTREEFNTRSACTETLASLRKQYGHIAGKCAEDTRKEWGEIVRISSGSVSLK